MNVIARSSSLLFGLLLVPLFIWAQTSNFIHYGVQKGLVQSQVQTIVQDKEGYLWIGTMAGLSRFNGQSFKTYTKKDGLAEDWVTTSYKDEEGNIWFGHWGGGVTKYNPKRDEFTDIKAEEFNDYKKIKTIFKDKNGDLWFGTEENGIFQYIPGQQKFSRMAIKPNLNDKTVNAIISASANEIWVATNSGVYRLPTNKSKEKQVQAHSFSEGHPVKDKKVLCLSRTSRGHIWVGTANSGIYVLGTDGKLISNLSHAPSLTQARVTTIIEDSEGKVWMGTANNGITQYTPPSSPTQNTLKGQFEKYTTQQGLSYNAINTILEDREKNIWIGTDLGIDQYKGSRFLIYDESDGLNNSVVWGLMEDNDHNLWIGSNGGVSRLSFNKDTGRARLTNKLSLKRFKPGDKISGTPVLCFYEDKQGSIWMGTNGGGITRYFPEKEEFKYYTTEDNLAHNTVWRIVKGPNGRLWMATKKGASAYNPATKEFKNYTKEDGLGGNKVYTIFKDSKENLWMGILGGELTKFNGQQFINYDESDGIKHNFILCITEDQNGNLWFGAYGGGLYKYDRETFKNYDQSDGLSSNSPYLLTCGKNNNIWIGTSRGIDKYNPREDEFVHYGKREGFLGIETNQNAVCKDHKGNIWFGTIMGAVKYNPREDTKNKVPPMVHITGLSLNENQSRFNWQLYTDTVNPQSGLPVNLQLSYDQNNLFFDFIGVSLRSPSKVKYKYKLEGFQENWSSATFESKQQYTNLPPGKYTFKVKAANDDDVWSKAASYGTFQITPPFWQKWWFYAGCGVVALIIIFAIIKWRERNFIKTQRRLEKQVQERTKELQEKNETLSKVNKEIEEKNKNITDSLRYAKRLQNGILPPLHKIYEAFPQSFVFYRPKELVSGDFYWFYEYNNTQYIAAVDCTGHGVPGAFMSMMGNDLLNQIIRVQKISDPSEILNALDKGVVNALQQSEKETDMKDGMDMGLCTIKNDTLTFAGALRPLYLIRNNELEEIKGDAFPIGGYARDDKSFSDNSFKIQRGDTIYMNSDGYPDQFGGPKGKKFMTKNYKQLLVDIQDKNMKEQHRVLSQTMDNWQKDEEQIDDMLIIGIRF